MLIQTNVRNNIEEVIDLELNGETFKVRVQEVQRQHVMKEVIFDMIDIESAEYREHKEDLKDGNQQCDQEGDFKENFDDSNSIIKKI